MSFLAKNIRFLRKQKGLKQEDVSAWFNKQANTVGNWENRKSEPNITELIKLSEALGVELNDLINTDVELEATDSAKAATHPPGKVAAHNNNVYQQDEPVQSMANEPGAESFWLLIRELRTINDRLDSIMILLKQDVNSTIKDKSNH